MLFLAYLDDHDLPPSTAGPWRELQRLRSGLLFIASDHTRSVVYHALKDHLPTGTPLLVTQLDEVPKFRGMAAGSLAWARRQEL